MVFSINGPVSIKYPNGKKMGLDPYIILYMENNQTWVIDLDVKGKTIVLRRTRNRMPHVTRVGKDFLSRTQRILAIKDKNHKPHCIRLRMMNIHQNTLVRE